MFPIGGWSSCPTSALCCSVFNFSKTKQLQVLSHLFCQIWIPAATQQVTSSLLSKQLMKNLGCPLWNYVNGTAQVLSSSCVKERGEGRTQYIRRSLQEWNISSVSSGYPWKGRQESMILSLLHCKADTFVHILCWWSGWHFTNTEYKKLPDFCLK